MDVKLDFLRKSQASREPIVAIFHKNCKAGAIGSTIAWIVIRHCPDEPNDRRNRRRHRVDRRRRGTPATRIAFPP